MAMAFACTLSFTDTADAATRTQNQYAQQIGDYFEQCHRVHVCNGSFLVAQAGTVLYQDAIGQATGDGSSKLAAESAFDIGSISKQFTAAAIIRLEEQGRLGIDQPVAHYLPGFPYPQITLRQLLTQTSGVPDVMQHYTDLLRQGTAKAPVELDDVVSVLAQAHVPLASPPGSQYAYSNTGYVLLGKVIETVSGTSYASFLRDEFFVPLGMDRTLVRTPANQGVIAERAMGFLPFADGRVKPADQIPNLFLYGAGGIYSTTGDLYRWAQALSRGQVMTAEHWSQATRSVRLLDGSTSPYGFGLSLKPSALGRPRITHGGHWRAFKTELTLLPDSNSVIVLLTNNGEDDSVEAARDAVEAILAGHERPVVAEPFPWKLAERAETYDVSVLKAWLASTLARHMPEADLAEDEVNDIGYRLLKAGALDKATAVLEFNRSAHPGSENALDSLADAYLATGDIDQAKAQLEAMLSLNPDSQIARKRLAELSR